MTKFTTLLSVFIINHFISASHSQNPLNAKDSIQLLNNKILATIDGVFISLRIDENFTKPKNVQENLLIHKFVQNVTKRNHKKYKEIHNLSKADVVNNKTAYFIFIINEVFKEIILREHHLSNTSIVVTKRSNKESLPVGKGLTVNFTDYNRKLSRFLVEDVIFKILFANPKNSYGHSEKKYMKRWVSNITRNMETRRIFNGQATTVEDYPFMASVHITGQFSCAGVIISKDLVITAASCLRAFHTAQKIPHTSVMVRVGSDFTSKHGGLVPVADMHFHPQYSQNTLANNLVLLKLAKRLNFNRKIRKILYDTNAYKLPENIDNILILGWGAKKDKESYTTSQPISNAFVDVYNLEECKNIYSRFYVKDNHFCTGYVTKGSGACNNDIGGPAIVGSLLTGIISFGSPFCGRPDAPTVFTKLGFYAKWLNNTINGNEKQFLRHKSEVDPKEEIDTLTELIGELEVAKHINKSVVEIMKEDHAKDQTDAKKMLYLAKSSEEISSHRSEFSNDPSELDSADDTTISKTDALKPGHQVNDEQTEEKELNNEKLHDSKSDDDDEAVSGDLMLDAENHSKFTETPKKGTSKTTRKPFMSTRIGDDFLKEMTISTESESKEDKRSSVKFIPALVTRKDRARGNAQSKIEIKIHHDAVSQRGSKKHKRFEIVLWNGGTTQRFPEFPKNRKSLNAAVDSESELEY